MACCPDEFSEGFLDEVDMCLDQSLSGCPVHVTSGGGAVIIIIVMVAAVVLLYIILTPLMIITIIGTTTAIVRLPDCNLLVL